MLKVDQIKNFFDCDECNKLLVDPIVLACGSVVCKSHTAFLENKCNEKVFNCGLCNDTHSIPENGFVVNKRIQNLLTIELNALKVLNKVKSPVFNDCKNEIKKAEEQIATIEPLEKNSELYIYEYFEDIKRQVDLRREKLKLEIDKSSDNLIGSIETTQRSLINFSKSKPASANIEKVKDDMNELIKQLDTLEFNDDKLKNIKKSFFDINLEFQRTIDNFNISLLGKK